MSAEQPAKGLNAQLIKVWTTWGTRFLPFADVATPELPLSRLLRLSLIQVSVGISLVLLVGTLNRVMIVELGVPASVVGVMLALPLSGWVAADRNDRPLAWFGLPVSKFGVDKATGSAANELHEILGWAMLALLALHIVGIIKHLVMDRDNLMPRMGVGKPRA